VRTLVGAAEPEQPDPRRSYVPFGLFPTTSSVASTVSFTLDFAAPADPRREPYRTVAWVGKPVREIES
jgi:hypothetical protein